MRMNYEIKDSYTDIIFKQHRKKFQHNFWIKERKKTMLNQQRTDGEVTELS